MDPNEEEKKKKGAADNTEEAVDKGRSAYSTYGKAQRLAKGAQTTLRGGQAAIGGTQAATAAASSIEVWGPVAVIIILLLLILLVVVLIFGGGAQSATPTCKGIIASSQSVSANTPVTLTEDGCTNNPVYSWTATDAGGVFSASNSASTTFASSADSPNGTSITITMSVCNATGLCNKYTTTLTVGSAALCTDVPKQYCSAEQCSSGEVAGSGTCPANRHCCTVSPSCATIDARLKKDFGVVIKEVSEFADCDVRKKIYQIYSIPFQSATYRQNIRPSVPFTLELYSQTGFSNSVFHCTSACGYTPSGTKIQLGGFVRWINNFSFKSASYLLQHETGHLIKHRNYTKFYINFPYSRLVANDPSCFSSCKVFKTYNGCPSSAYSKASETMAEAAPLYAYNSQTGIFGTISNFRTQCNDSYTYIKNALYGGTIIKP